MSTDCGSHGIFNPSTGQCDCMDDYNSLSGGNKWTGVFCQKPPVNIPCVRSSDDFRAAHGGGDESCGNWGKYGVCDEFTGTCSCGTIDPFYGVRCENECTNDNHCGGSLQPLADGTSRNIGACDKRVMRCKCANGWSGTQCRDEPPEAKCYNDAECSWGGVSRGACDEGANICVCDTDSSGRALSTGNRCSQRHYYEGADCTQDSDCEDKSNKCVSNKCRGSDGAGGMSTGEMAAGMVSAIWSPEGLATLFIDEAAEEMVEALYDASVVAAKAVTKSVTEMVSGAATKEAAEKVGTEMVVKVAAETSSKAVTSSMVGTAVKQTTEKVMEKASIGPMGWILLLLQVWTAVLDITDSQGLNMMVGQGTLDAMAKQFLGWFNGNADVIKAGFTLPRPYYPRYSVPFNLEYLARDNQIKLTNDSVDYLSRLTVNSNGQTIVPLFNPPIDMALNDKKEEYPLYWNMANNNVRVFNNLVEYGWSIWVLISLIVVSTALICVFTSDTVLAKMNKK